MASQGTGVQDTPTRSAKPGAILASNTSTLDLDRIAGFTRRPEDVVGLHFFQPPPQVMKLLEVVRGAKTAKEVLATVMALAKTLRKTAVVAGVCDGFIGNRMIEQYVRQALLLLEEGGLPAQIDQAVEAFGFAMGPFRDERPRGQRHRLGDPQTAAASSVPGCVSEDCRTACARPAVSAKDRRRLVRLPAR